VNEWLEKSGQVSVIYFSTRAIVICKNEDKARERNTFWHELTHAILFEMGHKQCRDEKFVTEFPIMKTISCQTRMGRMMCRVIYRVMCRLKSLARPRVWLTSF
jgi:hypothetical protein